MVCIICYDTLFCTLVADSPDTATTTDDSNRIAALSCGHTFHLECIKAWATRVPNFSCPICNVRQSGSVIPLFIEFDGENSANGAYISLERGQQCTGDGSTSIEYQNTSARELTECLVAKCKDLEAKTKILETEVYEKNNRVKGGQATIDKLTERVTHLRNRETELVTLSQRHKFRIRKLQATFNALKRRIGRMDSATSNSGAVQLYPDVINI
ncbi:hypothetical protein FBU31_000514 [Coemansia sp. 'formosensis']|nr:hypothetical protein FBU31_000514 [Coemansia sp. 'formosensis']